jgi:hypothetical protein
MRRLLGTSLLSVVALLLIAMPAAAVKWGPVVAKYNDIDRASGRGDFTNQNPYANNEFKLRDLYDDDNNVYGKTTFWYYVGGYFREDETKSTPEISDLMSQTFHLRDQLWPNGTRARAESWVCVQLGWPVPDACSPHALATFRY